MKRINEETESTIKTKEGIAIAITVILIMVMVYIVTAVFMTGEIGNKKTSTTTTSSSVNTESFENIILASKTFDITADTYKVIFFSVNDASGGLKTTLSTYDSSSKDIKLYKVNLDETINKYVIGDEANESATTSNELSVKSPTLITITNGVITSYISDESQILEELK